MVSIKMRIIISNLIHVILTVLLFIWLSTSYALNDNSIDWKEMRHQLAVADWVLYKQKAPKDVAEKSYNIFKKRADDGEIFATYFIAYDYYFKNDYKNAGKYFNAISEKYNGPGDSFLGYMYSNGKGVEKDLDLAIYHYQKHARSNDELSYRATAAYGISSSYQEKYKNSTIKILHKDSIEMRDQQMSGAWLYVSYWMGNKFHFNQFGSKDSLQNFLNESESNTSPEKVHWVKGQAAEICRTISGCVAPKI